MLRTALQRPGTGVGREQSAAEGNWIAQVFADTGADDFGGFVEDHPASEISIACR